ncbi:THO complex subunit 7B [Raphanus sativus]|nr:THO complex subunit 7B [Raphanus sativus]
MSVKARRLSGRLETVAAKPTYAFDPVDDDKIIKNRLLTRTTTTRGEPPLKKLQKKFTSFVLEVDKEEDNYSECGRLAKAFLQELATFEIPLLKSQALEESKVERQHKEECETIRKLIYAQPPRSETEKVICELKREIAELEAESTASWRLLELRKKQFALLLHVVDELQNTMEDEQKSLVDEIRTAVEDQRNIAEPMSVD